MAQNRFANIRSLLLKIFVSPIFFFVSGVHNPLL